jgi:hypothetical protein
MMPVVAMHAGRGQHVGQPHSHHSAVEIAPCSQGFLPGIGRTRNQLRAPVARTWYGLPGKDWTQIYRSL